MYSNSIHCIYSANRVPFHSSGQKPESVWEANSWWLTFGSILVLNIVTRFYNVHLPKWVCWDETHFGKMGSWYINQGRKAMSYI